MTCHDGAFSAARAAQPSPAEAGSCPEPHEIVTSTAPTGRPLLLLVHGRGQGDFAAQELLDLWVRSLSIGIGASVAELVAEFDVRMPFYGARLDQLTHGAAGLVQPGGTDPSAMPAKNDFALFQHAHVREVQQRHNLSDAKLRALGNGPGQAPTINGSSWVHAILRALDRIPGLSGEMLERLTYDVWLYMREQNVRAEINQIVEQHLKPGSRAIVIGHSFGSVIAYDILKDRRDITVPVFVTLGSPLGIHSIRQGLEPVRHPQCVSEWFNAFDRRDLIAMYPLDAQTFPVTPNVVNYDAVENRTTNAHGIFGYLSDPAVAAKICSCFSAHAPTRTGCSLKHGR